MVASLNNFPKKKKKISSWGGPYSKTHVFLTFFKYNHHTGTLGEKKKITNTENDPLKKKNQETGILHYRQQINYKYYVNKGHNCNF